MDNRLSISGTYSPSLQSRSVWRVIGPIVTASQGKLEACESQTDDFAFQQEATLQSLRLLLLTPSSIEPNEKQSTVSQLRHFATSNPSSHSIKVIAFLLSEDAFSSASGKYSLDGLLALQVFLFENLSHPMPVIPIPDAPSFLPCVHEYLTSYEDIPAATPSLGDSIALLAHATVAYHSVLPEQDTNILSDLFPSFRSLSQASRTRGGQDVIDDYLGEEQARNIVRFWQEDISLE